MADQIAPSGRQTARLKRKKTPTLGSPATGAQASYLKTLSEEVGDTFDSNLSKADESKRIDALRKRDPRLTRC